MVGQSREARDSLPIQNDGQPRVPRGASHRQSIQLKAKIASSRFSQVSQ